MPELNIRLLDQIIIGLGFLALVAIGIRCSRHRQTDEGYFLAGRSMPVWVWCSSLCRVNALSALMTRWTDALT